MPFASIASLEAEFQKRAGGTSLSRPLKNPLPIVCLRDSVFLIGEAGLRKSDERTGALFSYVGGKARLRANHPLRAVRALTNETLAAMKRDLASLYSGTGRLSIAPQMLLRAMLLQAFCSVRSERQLMERMEFDLLFRWFVGLGADEPVGDHSTFSKNRDRRCRGALPGDAARAVESEAPPVERSLQRRWHADSGLVLDEELQAARGWRGAWRRRAG